ncbi:uncharacterized protein LOC112343740, partial [Selaginella moellendorffii]
MAVELARRFPRRLYKLHEVDLSNPFLYAKKSPKDLPTQKVLSIVRTHGPIGSRDLWEHAEKEGIKSKTHMRRLLVWLRSKFLVHTQCLHGESAGSKNPGKRNKAGGGGGGHADDRIFRWVAVPPAPD